MTSSQQKFHSLMPLWLSLSLCTVISGTLAVDSSVSPATQQASPVPTSVRLQLDSTSTDIVNEVNSDFQPSSVFSDSVDSTDDVTSLKPSMTVSHFDGTSFVSAGDRTEELSDNVISATPVLDSTDLPDSEAVSTVVSYNSSSDSINVTATVVPGTTTFDSIVSSILETDNVSSVFTDPGIILNPSATAVMFNSSIPPTVVDAISSVVSSLAESVGSEMPSEDSLVSQVIAPTSTGTDDLSSLATQSSTIVPSSTSPVVTSSVPPGPDTSGKSTSTTAGTTTPVDKESSRQNDDSGGLSSGGKAAIGIIVSICIVVLIVAGVLFYRKFTHRSFNAFLTSSVRYKTYNNASYKDDEGSLILPDSRL